MPKAQIQWVLTLNAAEKRNAIGGDLIGAINYLSSHKYFMDRVKFSSSRYKHREVAARFLLVEDCLSLGKPIIDTKREYLDGLAERYKNGNAQHISLIRATASATMDRMAAAFSTKDELLMAQGIQTVYYLVFRTAARQGKLANVDRSALLAFRKQLSENRDLAASDYEGASFELLEFDRMNQQGTNDASSIKERYQTLCRALDLDIDSDVIVNV